MEGGLQQLRAKKPVILSGGRKKDGISFSPYTGGHAWVCDGFMETFNSYKDSATNTCVEYSMLLLCMNWGWDGTYNGYYYFNNFNPGTKTYNYQVKMFTNITP